jgi:hypothetical protein
MKFRYIVPQKLFTVLDFSSHLRDKSKQKPDSSNKRDKNNQNHPTAFAYIMQASYRNT